MENQIVKPKKLQRLTRKQRGFVKDYIETGGNGTEAALKNYDIESDKPEKVASVIATENLNKPSIVQAIQEALPDDMLAKKHLELLNAVNLEKLVFGSNDADDDIRRIISEMPGYSLLYIKEVSGSNGSITDKYAYVKAPDNMAQDKALDKAYKVKGAYGEKEDEKPKQGNTTYNFLFSSEVQDKVKLINETIKSQLINAKATE